MSDKQEAPPRIALVTGAAQGIGRGIALQLADDGFDVAVNDIQPKAEQLDELRELIILKNRRAYVFAADVSIEMEVIEMIAGVVDSLGGLDVIVANAGIIKVGSFVDASVDDWDRLHAINARGTFLCFQHAAKQMIKQGRGGRIIGSCSSAGKQGVGLLTLYSASKFSIRGLTQAAAKELGEHEITVNCYAPATIETPMIDAFADAMGVSRTDYYAKIGKDTPVGRHGTPHDVASVVSFLVSDRASFITGQCVSVNGGTYFD
ncbi:acetoin reductase family protein [Mycena maculata]|uniref:Acetoin reductase family protein n=1 Tax=Mycena maculata TaxID=230809 RepID=A0AAD7IYZ9_9AGAR|nr:acetoin reductase family protein [Mycena maculata]